MEFWYAAGLALGGGEQFGDKERIAGGDPVEVVVAAAGRLGQLVHGCGRQRRQLDARHRCGRQVAQHIGKRVSGADLVAAGAQHHHRTQQGDATAQVANQVERGIVGPMHILKDQDQGRVFVLDAAEEGREQPFGRRRLLEQDRKAGSERAAHIVQWAERPGGEQRLAPPPGDLCVAVMGNGELLQQRGLADAGLAFDQHSSAATGRRTLPGRMQYIQRRTAFEQFLHCHCTSVRLPTCEPELCCQCGERHPNSCDLEIIADHRGNRRVAADRRIDWRTLVESFMTIANVGRAVAPV